MILVFLCRKQTNKLQSEDEVDEPVKKLEENLLPPVNSEEMKAQTGRSEVCERDVSDLHNSVIIWV